MNENFLIGDGAIIEPQTPYRSALSQRSDNIELLRSKTIQIAAKKAEQEQKRSIVIGSSSIRRKLVEDLCQKNPLFKKTCNEIASDIKLINLQLLAYIQDVPPKSLDDWLCDWATLGKKVDRVAAIQLISNLPVSLNVGKLATLYLDEKAPKESIPAVLLYKLSGSWLWTWEEDSCIPAPIKDYYKPYEPLAFLLEARYRLIRGLFGKDKVNKVLFFRPAFAWLLSEAAFCRKLFQNSLKKDDFYQSWKLYAELLSNFDENNHLKWKHLKGLPDLISSLDLFFDRLGREEAKQDINFAEEYFEPYIKALKRWNARTRTGKAVAIPQFDNPDPPKRPRKRKG